MHLERLWVLMECHMLSRQAIKHTIYQSHHTYARACATNRSYCEVNVSTSFNHNYTMKLTLKSRAVILVVYAIYLNTNGFSCNTTNGQK